MKIPKEAEKMFRSLCERLDPEFKKLGLVQQTDRPAGRGSWAPKSDTYTTIAHIHHRSTGEWSMYYQDTALRISGRYREPRFTARSIVLCARELVRLGDVGPLHDVLEPSAGEGAIAEAIVEALGGAKRKKCICTSEIDKARFQILKQRFPEDIHLLGDFLKTNSDDAFERVIMNPPFGPHLLHVTRALNSLRQEAASKLVSVLPVSVQYREDKKHRAFREMLRDRTQNHRFIPLPDDSFKESGTQVRTCVLVVEGLK
jgi:predicted RNA methylase